MSSYHYAGGSISLLRYAQDEVAAKGRGNPSISKTLYFSDYILLSCGLWYLCEVGKAGDVILIWQIDIWSPWKPKDDQHVVKRKKVIYAVKFLPLKQPKIELVWHSGQTTRLQVERTEILPWKKSTSSPLAFVFSVDQLDYVDIW